MEDKLQLFYNSLTANPNIKGLPKDYNTFQSTLQDPGKSQLFYNSLKANKNIKGLPETYDDFVNGLSLKMGGVQAPQKPFDGTLDLGNVQDSDGGYIDPVSQHKVLTDKATKTRDSLAGLKNQLEKDYLSQYKYPDQSAIGGTYLYDSPEQKKAFEELRDQNIKLGTAIRYLDRAINTPITKEGAGKKAFQNEMHNIMSAGVSGMLESIITAYNARQEVKGMNDNYGQALIDAYGQLQELTGLANEEVPRYRRTTSIAGSIPYMEQFLLTGGIGTGAEAAAAKAGQALTKGVTNKVIQGAVKRFAEPVIEGAISMVGRVPLSPATYGNIAEETIGKLKYENGQYVVDPKVMPSIAQAIGKGTYNSAKEIFTESLGGMVALPKGLFPSVLNKAISPGVRKFFKMAGMNNPFGEYYEEIISNVLGGDPVDKQFLTDLLVTIPAITGGFSVLSAPAVANNMKIRYDNKAVIDNFGKDTVAEIRDLVESGEDVDGLLTRVRDLTTDANPKDVKNLLRYAGSLVQERAAREMEQGQQEGNYFTARPGSVESVISDNYGEKLKFGKTKLSQDPNPIVSFADSKYGQKLFLRSESNVNDDNFFIAYDADELKEKDYDFNEVKPIFVKATDIKERKDIPYSEWLASEVNEYKTAQQAINKQAAQAESPFQVGQPIDYEGKKWMVSDVNPDGTLIADEITDDEQGIGASTEIRPEDFNKIPGYKGQAQPGVTTDQGNVNTSAGPLAVPPEVKAQYEAEQAQKPQARKISDGKNEYTITPDDKGIFTVDKVFNKEKEATGVMGKLQELYPKVKFSLQVIDSGDEFTPDEYKIRAQSKKFKAADETIQPQQKPAEPEPEAHTMTRDEYVNRGLSKLPKSMRPEYIGLEEQKLKKEHKESVAQAVREGKQVPENVLTDYQNTAINNAHKAEEASPVPDETAAVQPEEQVSGESQGKARPEDRTGISKTDNKEIIAAVPKELVTTLQDGTKVYAVDGKYVRDNIFSDFGQGGNEMAYPEFVPKGEVWVEKGLEAEYQHIIKHEAQERDLMKQGDSYEDAHDKVKAIEDSERGIEAERTNRLSSPEKMADMTGMEIVHEWENLYGAIDEIAEANNKKVRDYEKQKKLTRNKAERASIDQKIEELRSETLPLYSQLEREYAERYEELKTWGIAEAAKQGIKIDPESGQDDMFFGELLTDIFERPGREHTWEKKFPEVFKANLEYWKENKLFDSLRPLDPSEMTLEQFAKWYAVNGEDKQTRFHASQHPDGNDPMVQSVWRQMTGQESTPPEVRAMKEGIELTAANDQVDVNPTEAQKEAGNYSKGHVTIQGGDNPSLEIETKGQKSEILKGKKLIDEVRRVSQIPYPEDKGAVGTTEKPVKKEPKPKATGKQKPESRTARALQYIAQNFDEAILQYFIGGGRIYTEDLIRYTGFQRGSRDFNQFFGLHSKDGKHLDVIHESLPNSFGIEGKGATDGINAVMEILNRFPSRGKMLAELEKRQNDLKTILGGQIPPEEDPAFETEDIKASDSEIEQAVNDIMDNPEVKAIVKEYSFDGTLAVDKLLAKIEANPGEFTIFPFALRDEELAKLKKRLQDEQRTREKTGETGPGQHNQGSEPGNGEITSGSDQTDQGRTEGETAEPVKPTYGQSNTVFTQDAAEKAREILRKKLNNLNVGFDPEIMQAGLTLAGYHIEAGARKFSDYSSKMIADLGEAIKPYLKSFYNSVRDFPGFNAEGMDSYEDVSKADIEAKKPSEEPRDDRSHRVFTVKADGSKGEEFDNLTESEAKAKYNELIKEKGNEIITWDKSALNKYGKSAGRPTVKIHTNKKELKAAQDALNKILAGEITELPGVKKAKNTYTAVQKAIPILGTIKIGGWYRSGEMGDAFMPFSIEAQTLNAYHRTYDDPKAFMLIMEHNFVQEGDLMTDPRIDVAVYPSLGMIIPLNFEQNTMGIYKEYVAEGKVIDEKGLNDTHSFLKNTWMPNLVRQGRTITEANNQKIKDDEPGQREISTTSIENQAKALSDQAENVGDRESAGRIIEEVDRQIEEIDSQLRLLGEYRSPEGYVHEYAQKGPEISFKKDLTKFSKELANVLGWEHNTDRKGKKVEYSTTNIPPAGGEGHIFLWKPDSDIGVSIEIPLRPDLEDYELYTIKELFNDSNPIRWSLTKRVDKYKYIDRHGVPADITVGELAQAIKKAADKFKETPKPEVKPETPKQPKQDLSKRGSLIPTPKEKFISYVKGHIARGDKITNTPKLVALSEQAGFIVGFDYKNIKELYDIASLSLNKYIEESGERFNPTNKTPDQAKQIVNELDDLQDLLPTETQRSQTQVDLQQFSTPPSLAFLVNWTAGITAKDNVLEPSAGEGNIAIYAKTAGAQVFVNEFDKNRVDLLSILGFNRVTQEDAKVLHAVKALQDVKITAVVMNPPFSRDIALGGKLDLHAAEKHIEAALNKLEDGGRLVAIVGKGMSLDSPTHGPWWNKIRGKYYVRANILINGDAYRAKGTTFDNRIIVIDKMAGALPSDVVDKSAKNYTELVDILTSVPENNRNFDTNEQTTRNSENKAEQPERTTESGNGNTPTVDAGSVQPGNTRRPGYKPARPSGNGGGNIGTLDLFGQSDISNAQPAGTAQAGGNIQTSGRSTDREPAKRTPNRRSPVRSNETELGQLSKQPQNKPGREFEGRGLSVIRLPKEKSVGNTQGYDNYTPEITVPGAAEHPTKLVESSAMASVNLPETDYIPKLSDKKISEGVLSKAQLEDIILAGNAHRQTLASGYRRGFFLGAGTGYGKGRTIAGIILDNWNQGSRKAVWISKNDKAHRDSPSYWEVVGGDKDNLFVAKNARNPISMKEGVLLTTYGTLRSGFDPKLKKGREEDEQVDELFWNEPHKNRVQQLAQWLGKDFDGVIVFDESHEMANSITTKAQRGKKKPSMQAMAGLELQKILPKAKIVYSSATGATEVSNLVYAQRLGLWGDGTSFDKASNFITAVENSGVAGMEIISKDLKAMGLYTAKTLSYDGVEYGTVRHNLFPEQIELYDKVANAWQIVLKNVNAAIEDNQTGKNAKSAALSAFWGAHQRFFSQIITTMEIPAVIQDVQKQLDEGKSVVIQMVNTGEAQLNRALAEARLDSEQEINLEELDLSPKMTLIEFLRNSFPVQMFEEAIDPDGNKVMVPVRDSQGNPVLNPESERKRDKLIAELERDLILPESPMDVLINTFGVDNVAEVTGRTKRVVIKLNKNEELAKQEETRSDRHAAQDTNDFMEGKKRILIFSKAGGTGASFHSDLSKKNQQQRVHYVLQAGWQADAAIQGFGRSHRSNQRIAPIFKLVTTNLKAQMRFLSSIARRLEQLGALTKGQRDTGGQGVLDGSYNLENRYARQGLFQFYQDIEAGKVEGVDMSVLEDQMALNIYKEQDGVRVYNQDVVFNTKSFLNRIMSLKVVMMNKVFDGFIQRLNDQINIAQIAGTYDAGIENVTAEKIKVIEEQEIYTDPSTKGKTYLTTFELTIRNRKRSWDEINQEVKRYGERFKGFYSEKNSGKLYAFIQQNVMDSDGRMETKYKRMSVVADSHVETRDFLDKYEKTENEEARQLWTKEYNEYPATRTKTETIVKGLMLPIWNKLPEKISVRRYIDENGIAHLGRYFSSNDIQHIAKQFEVENTQKYHPAQLKDIIRSGGKVRLSNGFELKKATYQSLPVAKILNAYSYRDKDRLEKAGVMYVVKSALSGTGDFYLPLDRFNEVLPEIEKLYNASVVHAEDADGNFVMAKKGGNVAFRLTDDIYFSPVERALDAVKQEKATPQQWKAMLLKNGAKQAELDWMGWDELARIFEGTSDMQRKHIQSWISQNKIEIREVQYPNKSAVRAMREPKTYTDTDIVSIVRLPASDVYRVEYTVIPGVTDTMEIYGTSEEDARGSAIAEMNNPFNRDDDYEDNPAETKYSQYTLPGGEDYKELLLTMPGKPVLGEPVGIVNEIKEEAYQSGHWNEPNVLAHVRFNTRKTEDGKNVLFIEEVQSDWAQIGKRQGFKKVLTNEELRSKGYSVYDNISNLGTKAYFLQGSSKRVPAHGFNTEDEAWDYLREFDANNSNTVPDMPFKQTDQWAGLVMRRMIRYAMDQGFDAVAWTPGKVQADRYDLSKQIDKIVYEVDKKADVIMYPAVIKAYPKTGDSPIVKNVSSDGEIEEFVGKEIAQKIINNEGRSGGAGARVIEGVNLKVGGSGMNGFYDVILPSIANKIGKKYGSQVIDGRAFTQQDATSSTTLSVHTLPITEPMFNAFRQGVPLYRSLHETTGDIMDEISTGKNTRFEKEIRGRLDLLAKEFGTIIVQIDNRSELPEHIKDEITHQGLENRRISGVYDARQGVTYAIVNEIKSVDEIAKTVFHEVVAHKGLPAMLGYDNYNKLLDDIYRSMDPEEISRIENIYKATSSRTVAEEYLGHMAEANIEPSLFQRIIASIRQMIRRLFKLNYSSNDIHSLLRQSRNNLIDNAKPKAKDFTDPMEYLDAIQAWHGSGRNFDKFLNQKAGSQAGLQLMGYGMYFTDLKEKAVQFASKKADKERYISEVRKALGDSSSEWLQKALFMSRGDHMKAISYLEERAEVYNSQPNLRNRMNRLLHYIDKNPLPRNRYLYSVLLHKDKSPENLNWISEHKPLSNKQTVQIADQLKKEGIDNAILDIALWDITPSGKIYRMLINTMGSSKEASMFLDRAGIDGIKFQNAEGSTNYLVFDDRNISISAKINFRLGPPEDPDTPETSGTKEKKEPSGPPVNILQTKGQRRTELWQNRMLSVREWQNKIRGRGGRITEISNPYRQENLSHGIVKNAIEEYDEKQGQTLLKAASELMTSTGMSYSELNEYMQAKYAPFVNKKMAEKTGREVNSGFTDIEAKTIVDKWEGKTDPDTVENFWKAKKEATDFTLNRWFTDGFISQETYLKIRAEEGSEYYVPLRGWKESPIDLLYQYSEQDAGRAVNPLRKRKGRTTKADDPLQYIYNMAHSAVVIGEKNRIKQHAARLVRDNKDFNDMHRFKKVYYVWDGTTDPDTGKKNYVATYEKPDQELWDQGMVKFRSDLEHFRRRPVSSAKEHEVKVFISGDEYVMVLPADVSAALNKAPSEADTISQTSIVRSIGNFNRWLSSNFTSKNPTFIPINMIRDLQYATLAHFVKGNTAEAISFLKILPKARKVIKEHLKGKGDKNDPAYQHYLNFIRNGGETGYVHLKDIDQLSVEIEKELRRLTGTNSTYDKTIHAEVLRKAGGWMENLAIMSENLSRFATYLEAKEAGLTNKEAAFKAKEITVNFNRKGRISNLMGSFYAFFNASLQGGENIIRMANQHKGKFFAIAAAGMSLGFLEALFNSLWGGDDDENKYENINDYLKYNNLVICLPKKNITIPLPHGFRWFHALGVLTYQTAMTDDKAIGKAVMDGLSNAFASLSPINPVEFITDKGSFTPRPIVPTVLVPWFDIAFNETFTGSPVHREAFTQALDGRIANSALGMPNVNKGLKKFTDLLFTLGGGNPETGSKFHVDHDGKIVPVLDIFDKNPSDVEHIIEYYLGGRGTFWNDVLKTSQGIVESVNDLSENDKDFREVVKNVNSNNVPVLRALIRQPWNNTTYTRYYDILNDVENYKSMVNMNNKAIDPTIETPEEYSPEYQYKIDLLKDLKRDLNYIKEDMDGLTDKQQIRELKDQKDLLIRNFVEAATKYDNQ